MADPLTELLEERERIAVTLAEWRRRWDAHVAARRGSAENSMSGLKPLDERSLEIARAGQPAPILSGGLTQPA